MCRLISFIFKSSFVLFFKVIRDDNSVTSNITINYDKIDIDQLLNIEGSKDNIVEDGKAKVDKWMSLAKKFGTKCKTIEEE